MARTYKEYRQLLQSLLPKGAFWTRAATSTFTELLDGLGEELSRVEQRSENLFNEQIADTITELLEDHELDYGIPESGFELATTTAGRRSEIKAKRLATGQQYPDYFIEFASNKGWTITITQFPKSLAGIAKAGESFATGDDSVFFWMVNIWVEDPNDAYIYELTNDIDIRKPGHTIVLYRFYNVGFSNGFDNGFSAEPWWDGRWWPLGYDRGFSIGFANNSDYIGRRFIGGFSNGFDSGFYTYIAGGFNFNGFDAGFLRPK